jgi:geranylgeranyl pyrophosphate synthase
MTYAVDNRQVLDDYLDTKKALINKELLRILLGMKPKKMSLKSFEESTSHSVIIGGKRIRPILTLAAHEACQGNHPSVLQAACSIELVHAGSLILDDLPCMDNADLRRGQPTNHKLYGESTTILTAAALWVKAFEVLSNIQSPNTNKITSSIATAMGSKGLVQGQLLDLAFFNSVKKVSDLEECYRLKTGVLFGASVSIGALLADASTSQLMALQKFGEQLGIAFQIRDDIIDETQTAEESGKDAHLDVINNKPTYVSLLGLEGARKALKKKTKEAIDCLSNADVDSHYLEAIAHKLLTI